MQREGATRQLKHNLSCQRASLKSCLYQKSHSAGSQVKRSDVPSRRIGEAGRGMCLDIFTPLIGYLLGFRDFWVAGTLPKQQTETQERSEPPTLCVIRVNFIIELVVTRWVSCSEARSGIFSLHLKPHHRSQTFSTFSTGVLSRAGPPSEKYLVTLTAEIPNVTETATNCIPQITLKKQEGNPLGFLSLYERQACD